jgi:uncharacterized protein YwqG
MHPRSREEIAKLAVRHGLVSRADALAAAALPSRRIRCTSNLTTRSRMGGDPDLTPGVEWPRTPQVVPLQFVAQIDLAEAAVDELPATGLVSFFYLDPFEAPDDDPAALGRVIVEPDPERTCRVPAPVAVPGHELIECGVRFERELTLPPVDSVLIEELRFSSKEIDRYWDLTWDVQGDGTIHRLLGHPDEVQNDLFSEVGGTAREWRLLLQVDSALDDPPKTEWADAGRVYFCLRMDDLAAARLERSLAVLQSY